jgi:hypothetical protein
MRPRHPHAAESGVGKHTARESERVQACAAGKEHVTNAHPHKTQTHPDPNAPPPAPRPPPPATRGARPRDRGAHARMLLVPACHHPGRRAAPGGARPNRAQRPHSIDPDR